MATQFGLFGPTPEQLRMAEQARREQTFAQQAQGMGAFGPLYQISRGLTSQGINTLGQALFPEAQSPQLQQATALQALKQQYAGVDLSDPNNLMKLATDLSSVGAVDQAMQVATQARTIQENQQKLQAEITLKEAQAEKAGRETGPKFSNPAEQALYEGFLAEANGDASRAARLMSEYKSSLRQREAAAGIPPSGEVKVTDLNTATQIVDRFTKEPSQRLGAVRQLRVSLSQAKGGTGAAVPQLRRDLIKLVGDNQIGQNEVQQALGSIGIVGDAISGINQLLTGTPSPEKLKDVEKFINALEKAHAQSYNASRGRAEKVLSEGRLNPETVKSLVPPPYELKGPASKSKFVEGKIYKDSQGNRARYVNGKFEPVK